jgi:hypothetical protein
MFRGSIGEEYGENRKKEQITITKQKQNLKKRSNLHFSAVVRAPFQKKAWGIGYGV